MARYKKGNDRNQISLLPMCLADMLSDDAEVRALEIIVDKMVFTPISPIPWRTQDSATKAIRQLLSNIISCLLLAKKVAKRNVFRPSVLIVLAPKV